MIYPITDKRVYDMALELEAITKRPELQPGVKNANGIETTWCIYYLYEAAVKFGYDMAPLLEPEGIGWTNANAAYKNGRKSNLAGMVETVVEHEAQYLANEGHIIAVLAFNLNTDSKAPKSGHCAVVKPYGGEFDYEKGSMIVQAGESNGTYRRREMFNFAELTPPIFIKLKKI